MSARKTVRFYYAVGSRYSYLASTQMATLERQTGCEVVWRPLHSADLYALRGASPFEGRPVSGQYDWDYRRLDAERWADYYGVPYKEPRGAVDFDPRLLARACVAADTLGAVRPYSGSLFSAAFVESLPEIGTEQCVERAETLGAAGRRLRARARLAGDGTAARRDGRGGALRRGFRGAHLRRRRQDLLGQRSTGPVAPLH